MIDKKERDGKWFFLRLSDEDKTLPTILSPNGVLFQKAENICFAYRASKRHVGETSARFGSQENIACHYLTAFYSTKNSNRPYFL